MLGKLFGAGPKINAMELIEQGSTVVDVRSPAEFAQGHHPGSVNIPLDQVQSRLGEIKKFGGPLLVCCASGMRSGQAQRFLTQQGLEVHNVGSWMAIGR